MISVKVDSSEVLQALAKLEQVAKGEALGKAFSDVGETLVSNIQGGFKQETDPWGVKWKPLSHNTRIMRARKAMGKGKRAYKGKRGQKSTTAAFYRAMTSPVQILRDTSRLMSSINHKVLSDGVEVGTSDTLGKALMHQFGGTIKGKMFRGAKVPARPFMPIRGGQADLPNDWQADVLDVLTKHINKVLSA